MHCIDAWPTYFVQFSKLCNVIAHGHLSIFTVNLTHQKHGGECSEQTYFVGPRRRNFCLQELRDEFTTSLSTTRCVTLTQFLRWHTLTKFPAEISNSQSVNFLTVSDSDQMEPPGVYHVFLKTKLDIGGE